MYKVNNYKYIFQIQKEINKSIIFYKTSPQIVTTQDALSHINIMTLASGAAESLYQILRQIYSPLLAIVSELCNKYIKYTSFFFLLLSAPNF